MKVERLVCWGERWTEFLLGKNWKGFFKGYKVGLGFVAGDCE